MSRKVIILVYEDAVLSSVAAALDIFTRINDILIEQQQVPAFDVTLVALEATTVKLGTSSMFNCLQGLSDYPPKSTGHHQHLIVIPAFSGLWDDVLRKNREVLHWLKQHYQCGNEIASLCKGSFFWQKQGCRAHPIGL